MRRVTPLLAVAVLAAACADSPTAPGEELAPFNPSLGANAVYGSYIVELKEGANPRSVLAVMGINPNFVYTTALNGFAADLNDGQLNALRRNPSVERIEGDQTATISVVEESSTSMMMAQSTPWGITRVGGAVDGTGKTAWVIDTGIDLVHQDLNTSRACHRNFVTRGTNSPAGSDGNGHGTHVAGTIAAKDNTLDVVGVAPNAYVCAVRVLDNRGSGQYSWIIAGVDYVASAGASGDVANMSLGGGASSSLDNAVANAASRGINFTLAAGNESVLASTRSPARVNGPNIYTISSIASNGCLSSFSNYGNPPVDFAEPGSSILSLRRGGGTTTMSGTSMAAPHAAGLVLTGGIRAGGAICGDRDSNADQLGVR